MRPLLLAIAILALTPAGRTQGRSVPCDYQNVERVVAIGDVHGAYTQLVQILTSAGLLDARLRWSGGKTHVVQVGDMLDRGPDSRRVLDLYRRLEREATSAGGRVHVLLGNHEVMRLIGDYRYVHPGEYQAFATGSSATLRANFVENVADPELKKHFASQPLGALELIQAFGAKEPYGTYLRTLNAVVRINDVLFVHGGISPTMQSLTCTEINARVRADLTEGFAQTVANPAASWAMKSDGPLWYRGLAQEPEGFAPQVEEMLRSQAARAIVIAHTPREDGRVGVRFGGRVLLVDTGMQPGYVPTGRPSALEIVKGIATAVYPDGREDLGPIPERPVAVTGAAHSAP